MNKQINKQYVLNNICMEYILLNMFSNGVELTTAYPPIVDRPSSIYGYQTHNLYKDHPPMMSDGRVIVASWQPEAVANNHLVKMSGVTSNWQYRQYLTHNATGIVRQNLAETMNDIGYIARYAQAPETPYRPPYTYHSYLDRRNVPSVEQSDLKDLYFSKEELNARTVAPAITQEQLISSSRFM
jgi:hypothetical protein